MSLDLAFDDFQTGIAATLSQFCRERWPVDAARAFVDPSATTSGIGTFPQALWRDFAKLGVLALATPEGEGGACEIVAAMESLGAAVFPGPLAATFFATQVLGPDERAAVCDGSAIVSVGRPPLLPFAPIASVFLEIDGESAHRLRLLGSIDPVDTLGGEVWGRVECERVESLVPNVERGLVLHRIALSSYLVGAAETLVRAAADYARTRRQFGRAIGEFQAVAHPLADCHIRLTSARLLARSAADRLDREESGARLESHAAFFSARRAAREAVHVCHQTFGAVGVTLEGPAFFVSRSIMQLSGSGPEVGPGIEALHASILHGRGHGVGLDGTVARVESAMRGASDERTR